MSLFCVFVLLFLLPEGSAKDLMKNGQKVAVLLDYGAQVSGWISYFSPECIVLTDQNGPRGIDPRLISSIEIDGEKFQSDEIHTFLYEKQADSVRFPREKTMFALGLVNAGIPFFVFKEKRETITLGLFDVVLLGGGIYSVANKGPAGIPIFVGLAGLRLWSAIEGASRVRKNSRRKVVNQCLSIGK